MDQANDPKGPPKREFAPWELKFFDTVATIHWMLFYFMTFIMVAGFAAAFVKFLYNLRVKSAASRGVEEKKKQ
ncbi:hypothetical protein ACRALDRAFT_1059281 [Sodiomyces alcalophilus JCM 7366]|uniref:uncharacterized protein n=1 Tax=Sodiomyces alcalophilus JCM 7366 TaxID=591952 RepID=UPI0039B3A760